jgi:hypothetical protein
MWDRASKEALVVAVWKCPPKSTLDKLQPPGDGEKAAAISDA